jgi:uncharacterized protein YebE (UPF0316 family)
MTEFLNSDIYKWVVLPLLIFIARMSDVTLATLRNIFLSKSVKYIVPFMGFFEALIWLLAISQIMKSLGDNNPFYFLAYAAGYSMGIFVGIKIEERLALGIQVMRIITNHDYDELVSALRASNFGTTIIDGHGSKGPVKIILTVFKRKDFPVVQSLIKELHPSAFYSVEDIRNASHGVFPTQNSSKLETLKRVFPYSAGR